MRDAPAGIVAGAIALAAVALAAAQTTLEPGPASPLRHLWAAPVLGAALRFGAAGGGLAAIAATVLQTPRLFVHLEDAGLSALAVDDLATVVTLAAAGPLVGALAGEARRQRERYDVLTAAQRALAEEAPLSVALDRLRAALRSRLPGSEVALAVLDGARVVVAGGDAVAPGSAVARVLERGAPLFAPAAAGGLRPVRALVVPLLSRGEVVGALAVERRADVPAGERAALAALGAHVGLALENARLAARQRRFTEELQRTVAEATRELEAAGRARSAFVAIASHELRTPLSALLGFAELLAERPFAAAGVVRVAGIIRRETERMARIVDDLLDLSRLERGLALRVVARPTAVGPAIEAALDLLRGGALEHRFAVEVEPALPPAHVDADALDRVLKNLIANAVKYSPPGSTVRIGARAVPGGIEIAVADEGRGIPTDALPRIFEPYFRAPGASESAAGLGLGLAVVKALVEAHGGTIRAESVEGTGTRVTFVVPALP